MCRGLATVEMLANELFSVNNKGFYENVKIKTSNCEKTAFRRRHLFI